MSVFGSIRGAPAARRVSSTLQSLRETRDLYLCIEWAATQPWSSGKVGLNGISYYATNQWSVAGLQPPHLAAICVWEGSSDQYREAARHGGIPCLFAANWFEMQVKHVQHGFGARGARSRVTGELVCGPDTLTDERLAQNRLDPRQGILDHPNYDETYRRRAVDWSKVTVPLLSAANWGGQGLHTRGNFEGLRARHRRRNGSRCMVARTGPRSTPTMA